MTLSGRDLFHTYDAESGHFISEQHRRVAEIIHDYDERLSLVWIPPADRETEHDRKNPFAIMFNEPGQEPYVVRYVTEQEVDARLLAWLWTNDNERNNPLKTLEAMESAQKALELHAQQEARDEAMEIGEAILKSPLHSFKHNGKVYT